MRLIRREVQQGGAAGRSGLEATLQRHFRTGEGEVQCPDPGIAGGHGQAKPIEHSGIARRDDRLQGALC
ncbi:MAG: hypothetical protein O2798_10335 [Chloroflexi bacterium]|nr:hypothetical protein [Chloroflexota bacterium]MDA1241220.1 hypothetical protein [Chloroflexota bacterium]